MKKLIIITLLFTAIFTFLLLQSSCKPKAEVRKEKPNILFIFIDDLGYRDIGCYGNTKVATPNIDHLASEGIRFEQFYVNSPICSPSRVAVTTGQYPSRWGITTFISSSEHNKLRGIKDYLDISAPSIARELKKAGYYTAHIGKWHMGGGRDVDYAPLIIEYGFDESLTQFEGLGDRYLATYETLNRKDSTRSLERRSADLGKGEINWAKRENFTKIFVDRSIEAIEKAKQVEKPFYINLWPDDIHTPLEPPEHLRGDLSTHDRFLGVMEEMDRQLGRIFDFISSDPELRDNTLIIFTSDNGPDMDVNDAAPLKGTKTTLYEGGIRVPFIAWWRGEIPESKTGYVDRKTVIAGFDLPPTFMAVAGIEKDPGTSFEGENRLSVLKGQAAKDRKEPLFWMRPPDRPGYDGINAPDLAIRKGDYKLLMDWDGSNLQLYNIVEDPGESRNLTKENPIITEQLREELQEWYEDYPHTIRKDKIQEN